MDESKPHFDRDPNEVTDQQLGEFIDSIKSVPTNHTEKLIILAVVNGVKEQKDELKRIYKSSLGQKDSSAEEVEFEGLKYRCLELMDDYINNVIPTLNLKPEILKGVSGHRHLLKDFPELTDTVINVYLAHKNHPEDESLQDKNILALRKKLNKIDLR